MIPANGKMAMLVVVLAVMLWVMSMLTLTVLGATVDARQLMHCNTLKQDNDSTVRGDGEVGSARYEPALLPPCPSIRVLSYSNCQEIHSRQQTGLAV